MMKHTSTGCKPASGGLVASSGMPFANTAAIISSSYINSVGTAVYTGGMTDVSVSFGAGSYNITEGSFRGIWDWKDLNKKEKIGYGFGALANISDILSGFKPGEVQLNTEHSDAIGHSSLTNVGETNPHNSIVSVGPDPGGNWIFNPFKFKDGTNNWKNYVDASDDVWKVKVKGINIQRINNYGDKLNGGVKYNLYTSSCVNHTARALTLSGAPTIGIHPFILHIQLYLRSIGIRPILYTYHFNQF